MDKLECHSGTQIKEVLDFIDNHPNQWVEIHFEYNMGHTWGDDGTWELLLTPATTQMAKDFVKKHYIHGIKTIKK